jgi:hypothetical protein
LLGGYAKLSVKGTLMPSMEPTLMTRAGSAGLAAFSSSGSRSRVRKNVDLTLVFMTLSQPDSG